MNATNVQGIWGLIFDNFQKCMREMRWDCDPELVIGVPGPRTNIYIYIYTGTYIYIYIYIHLARRVVQELLTT